MILHIKQDHNRFRDIVKGKIRGNFKKYISQGEMIGKREKDFVSIPMPSIEILRCTLAGWTAIKKGTNVCSWLDFSA